MHMRFYRLSTRVGALDFLLAEIALALQLMDTQVARMESAYRALAAWLEHPDSPLAAYGPILVYPQGSAAIGTTVRPLLRAEFDLDFVIEVAFFPGTPMELYELVVERLQQHRTYATMLERKRRCVRILYEDGFHADVLGSRTAVGVLIPGSIEVPDRETPTLWKGSNPRGFAQWFIARSREATEARFLAKAQPLPSDWAAEAKTVLQRIVQLAKRGRDVAFGARATAPRSIFLTTLEATVYRGELSVYEALVEALDVVASMIEQARPNRLVVLNPMNAEEDFSESWDDPTVYSAFTAWLFRFRKEVHALREIEGIEELTKALGLLFGEDVSKCATHRYQKALAAARSANQVRSLGPAIITTGAGGQPIPRNHNYGAEY
jgi:hypothetical protein